jgi:glutamate-1-semialdehyde aminotransferase
MLTHAELNLAQVIRLLVYESQRIAVVASATEAAVRALHERN